MATHHDLLEQARHLANHDRGKPQQVNLRRAISTAYYALFHRLTSEAASRFVTGPGRDALRIILQRSFTHTAMNLACKEIIKSTMTPKYRGYFPSGIPNDLSVVARTFVDLQQARHEADYDFSKTVRMNRVDTVNLISQVANAFNSWDSIRKTVSADTFLLVMLLSGKSNHD